MGFLDENGWILKTKSMVLPLSNIISTSSMFPSPMQIHKTQFTVSTYKHCQAQLPGLKTLIYEHETLQIKSPNPLIIHSYKFPQSLSSSSPPSSSSSSSSTSSGFLSLNTHSSLYSSWSSGMDDMLGTESGVYMIHSALKMLEIDHKPNGNNNGNQCNKKSKRGSAMAVEIEYPPPIPSLARTGNLPGHMPWILARYYSNGRLVLKEEKVKHHEYFEAYRENGRLVLDLVSLDVSFRCCHSVFEENNDDEKEEIELEDLEYFQGYQELEKVEEDGEESDEFDDEEDINGKVNQAGSMTSAALSVPELCDWGERYGDPRKCLSFTYSGMIISQPSSIVSQC